MSVFESVRTTIGRVLFNQVLPDRLRFVNKAMNRNALRELVADCYRLLGSNETAHLVDGIKADWLPLRHARWDDDCRRRHHHPAGQD